MEAVFILLVIFSVPLVAIVAAHRVKVKQLEVERAQAAGASTARLAELEQRIEALETIVTSGERSFDARLAEAVRTAEPEPAARVPRTIVERAVVTEER